MRARQDENHWQSCWTDGKPDRNINLKFTIMKLKCRKWRHNVKSFEVKKGHFIKSHHKWKQIIAIVTPFICIFEKTFVVNFDPFLPFSLSTSRISIVLSHLLFILNVNKYWKYSSIIPLSTLRNSKFSKAASNCACGVKRVIGSFMYDHWISNVHRRMTRVSYEESLKKSRRNTTLANQMENPKVCALSYQNWKIKLVRF